MMRKQFTLILLFVALVFQGMTQWYWQHPIPQGNPINDLHMWNNNIGYAVASHGSILFTEDNGTSWTLLDSITTNELTSVYIGQQQYAHIVGDFGTILRTTDGMDWESMNSGTHYRLNGVASTPSASKTFAVGYKGIILRNEMNWDDWEKIDSPTLNTLNAIDFATDQIGVIVGDSGIILRTENGGESWTTISTSVDLTIFDIHFPTTTTGYFVGKNGLMMKTTDAGISWTDVSSVQVENNLNSVYFANDSTGCVAGAYGAVITTSDGGQEWEFQFNNYFTQFFTSYYQNTPVDSIGDTIIVAGAHGMILKTTANSGNWHNTTSSSAFSLNDILILEENNGYAIGGDPYIDIPYMLKYVNNDSIIWQEHKIDTIKHYLTEIYFLDNNLGYMSGGAGSIYKTEDKGESWTPLNSGVQETLYSIFFLNNLLGFAAGSNGTIIKTTSGDTTWTQLDTGTENNLYSLYLTTSYNGGFAVGESGTILRVESGGNEIYPVPSVTSEPLYDVFICSDTVAFAVGFNGVIVKIRTVFTEDIPVLIASGVTTPLNNVFFTNDTTGYIVGDGGVILKSTNRGDTWYSQYSGTGNNLKGISFTAQNSGYIAGSGISILKTTNAGGGVILPFITEVSNIDYHLNIYPNPVSADTWIEYELADKGNVQISLYDLSGREIKKIQSSIQLQGKQKVKMDAASLQAGIYLVVLKVNDQLTSKKLIIY